MNEKIKALKAEARDFYLDQEDLDCSNNEFVGLVTEKFAELIIQECCNMVNAHIQHNNPYDCPLVLDIKEHFGVE